MTLSKFKKRLKIASIASFAIFYGLSLYSLGKHQSGTDPLQVKGATTVNEQSDKIEKPLPYADVQSSKVISQSVKLCSNTTLGFQISYPANWFTTYNEDSGKCKYFAPYSFVVPEYVEKQFVPVEVTALTLEVWESTVKFYENPNEYENVISSQAVEIGGHLVKRIETSATGQGSKPRGFTQLVYLVFDSKNPLQLIYQQFNQTDDANTVRSSLEDIVQSIEYF